MLDSPSDLAIISGYVYTPEIFDAIEEAMKDLPEGDELVYTLAVDNLVKKGIGVHALEIKDAAYRDTGNKLEYLKTVIDYGLNHPDFGEQLKEFLKTKV